MDNLKRHVGQDETSANSGRRVAERVSAFAKFPAILHVSIDQPSAFDVMNDAIASGFGGESGDQILRATSALRPLWTLTPLPLTQVNPSISHPTIHRGRPKSLQHLCLGVISRNFHTYTSSSFEGLSGTLSHRIFHKVQHDRQYEVQLEGEVLAEPDQATIWAMSLFADPESAEDSHTLALPVDVTLAHFVPRPTFANPIHPFIEIPTLYATLQPESPYQLITSLHLDGVNDLVTDQSITSLKFAVNLTVLRLSGCRKLTDSGIRLLAASLELPGRIGGDGEGRGMWRLRAWYLHRCRGVSDKSMSAFARWPGLVLLDVRNTSVTTTGMTIFNRHTEAVFSGSLARMQPCSPGLRELFGSASPSSHLVNLLTLSLLQPDDGLPKRPIPFRSLNLISARAPPKTEHLPNPPVPTTAPRGQPARTEGSRYLAGGVGQLYGAGVASMADEVRSFRQDVQTALHIQAVEDGLVDDDREEKEDRWWEKKHKTTKGKTIKEKKFKQAQEKDRSKEFVANGQVPSKPELDNPETHTQGKKEMMMVRVAQKGWERLTWAVGSGNAVVKAEVKVAKGTNLVGDILSSTAGAGSQRQMSSPAAPTPRPAAAAKKPAPGSTLFRPAAKPKPSPFPIDRAPASSAVFAAPRRPSNPFSTASVRPANTFGVRPLSSSPAEPSSSVESATSDGFGSSGKKRSWGGVVEEGGGKRRGMKMFSGARM